MAAAFEEADENEDLEQEEEVPVPLAVKLSARRSYLGEVVIGLCLAAYIINFYLGRKKNETIAVNWKHTLSPVLQANFSHVGVNDKSEVGELLQ
jgi:hypothetical protein